MGSCITNKKGFPTEQIAEDALIEARTKYDYPSNEGPVNIYKCDDCGSYHLTSQGTMNERLEKYLKEGKIQRQKEADYWIAKLNHHRKRN